MKVGAISRGAVVALVSAALVATSACGDDDETPDSSSRDSEVYTAILDNVAADQPVEDEETPIVYVAPLGNEKPIPLDVQVSVVDAIADLAVVRFVDEAEQAIDQDGEGEPVLDDAVLVSLGSVPPDGSSVHVPGELYRTAADSSAVEYEVSQTADGWVVIQARSANGWARASRRGVDRGLCELERPSREVDVERARAAHRMPSRSPSARVPSPLLAFPDGRVRDPDRVDGGRDGQAIGALCVERTRDREQRPGQVLLSPIQRRLDHELVATQRTKADEVEAARAAQDHAEGGEADRVARPGEYRDERADDPRDLEPGLEPRERPALLGVGSKALREAVERLASRRWRRRRW